ncbi:MAG TPA: NADH pyrophosphatase, partial [Alphaproteobacteria bacterium]|nr:NADH pyrophosphatase [Alphaproteobacteria bacterium]
PFPSSLMVGFVAEALDDKLNLNREEIDSAAWFTREQLINSPEDETFKLSRKDSISRALVNDWIAQG